MVPAAPALVEIDRDQEYREALLNSDLALTDSGFMVLVWSLLKFEKIRRLSGLEYLKALIAEPIFREPGTTLWVMPSGKSRDKAIPWLRSRGLPVSEKDFYIAPIYEHATVSDPALVDRIHRERPLHIILALAGGLQEKLGRSIQQNTKFNPGIHCIGAAIGFLSGDQVNIPDWADHLFLGWLFRCLSQPSKFIPRYMKAARLLPMMIKYRENLPR